MSCDCEVRDGLFVESNLKNLDKFSKMAFSLIKKHIDKNLVQEIKKPISELDSDTFKIATKNFGNTPKGAYNNIDHQIILQQNFWCIKTLIHENLHSCSITARIPNLLKYRSFFEGITEFFAGYILYREFSSAYEHCWKGDSTLLCSMSYGVETRTMISIARYVPMMYIRQLYFGKTLKDWQSSWESVEKYIKTKIDSTFSNPLNVKNGLTLFSELQDQCIKWKNFEQIFELTESSTDLSKILQK